MPVSALNLAASSRSRLWLWPTALSPTKVIVWPPYFALSAFAFATAGGLTADADETDAGPELLADRPEAGISASAAANPARTISGRCFTAPLLFSTTTAAVRDRAESRRDGRHARTRGSS